MVQILQNCKKLQILNVHIRLNPIHSQTQNMNTIQIASADDSLIDAAHPVLNNIEDGDKPFIAFSFCA